MRKKINDFILILAIFTLLINDEAKIRHFFTANCALKYIMSSLSGLEGVIATAALLLLRLGSFVYRLFVLPCAVFIH